MDKESSIGGATSSSLSPPPRGRPAQPAGYGENNKQKFARNFGFKMILAGGYRMRTVVETWSFDVQGYKVMINFRTSPFSPTSPLARSHARESCPVFLSLLFPSVLVLSSLCSQRPPAPCSRDPAVSRPCVPSSFCFLFFSLNILLRWGNRCNKFYYIFAWIRKALKWKVRGYYLPTDKTVRRKFELPIIARVARNVIRHTSCSSVFLFFSRDSVLFCLFSYYPLCPLFFPAI